MFDPAQTALVPAREVARITPLAVASNGLRWASYGFTEVPADTLQHIIEAVPPSVADALKARAYYFVPLAIGEPQSPSQASESATRLGAVNDDNSTEIAPGYSDDLSDRATCHRTLLAEGVESTFISARLMQDKFALAFEFFINASHQFVDSNPAPDRFQSLLWSQLRADIRGETSQDAYESRKRAAESAARPHLASVSPPPQASPASPGPNTAPERSPSPSLHPAETSATAGIRETFGMVLNGAAASTPVTSLFSAAANKLSRKRSAEAEHERPLPDQPPADPARTTYYEAAFADALAIYMLSLTLDLDYADLREREYPLLAAPALADRLRLVADLYPPPPAYEFAIRYRRRH